MAHEWEVAHQITSHEMVLAMENVRTLWKEYQYSDSEEVTFLRNCQQYEVNSDKNFHFLPPFSWPARLQSWLKMTFVYLTYSCVLQSIRSIYILRRNIDPNTRGGNWVTYIKYLSLLSSESSMDRVIPNSVFQSAVWNNALVSVKTLNVGKMPFVGFGLGKWRA